MEIEEVWKRIPFANAYEVSNLGNVRHGERALKPWDRGKGYLSVKIYGKAYQVHCLVALCFLGACPNGQEVCHENGIRDQNRLSNLYYGTRRQNAADRIAHGNGCAGEKHPKVILSGREVIIIRDIYSQGVYSYRRIASMFGVSNGCIQGIINRSNWRHI